MVIRHSLIAPDAPDKYGSLSTSKTFKHEIICALNAIVHLNGAN